MTRARIKLETQSLKYALLQVLCISDAKDDADGSTYEASYRGSNESRDLGYTVAAPDLIASLKRQIGDLPGDHRETLVGEWKQAGLHSIDYLAQGEEVGKAAALVHAHVVQVHRAKGELPPPSVAEAFNLNPTAIDPAEAVEQMRLGRATRLSGAGRPRGPWLKGRADDPPNPG